MARHLFERQQRCPLSPESHHADVPGAEELFHSRFSWSFIVAACDKFKPAIEVIRQKRGALIDRAIRDGVLPTFPPESEANSGDWTVPGSAGRADEAGH